MNTSSLIHQQLIGPPTPQEKPAKELILKTPESIKREEYLFRINRVIDHIESHLDEELSLNTLSRVANFSPFYFHRIFKAMVGETLNQFIQRVRIEKAASQLLLSPHKSITEIALEHGFSTSASFARLFKDTFQLSATQWRSQPHLQKSKIDQMERNNHQTVGNLGKDGHSVHCHIDPVTHQFKWRINMKTINDIKIEVKQLPELHVAYVRHIGAYAADEELFRGLFERLMKWAVPRGLYKPAESQFLSVYHDDPKITDETKLRTSICISVPEDTEVGGEIGKMRVPGGTFAVAHCQIQSDQYEQAWDAVMGDWLPQSGYQPDDRICYELNLNNPDDHPEKLHIVDICVPVKPL